MFITNSGSLTTNRKFTQEEVERIKSVLTKSEVYDNEISVEEEYGDIECDLKDLLEDLPGVIINGQIDYYGDYDGRYEVKDSVLSSLNKNEVAIREASVEELLKEIARRGTPFCRYILITTVERETFLKGFSSVESAKNAMLEAMQEILNKYGIDPEDAEDYGVDDDGLSAWITINNNYDWKIVDMLHPDSVM